MKKKIFVIGPVLSPSGYGEQSRFALRSLRSREDLFDIYLQPIPWGQTGWVWEDNEFRQWMDERITETQILIQSSTNGSDWTTVRTINSTSLTDDTTNYIRFNLINGRYVRIYGNSGDSKVLAVKADMRINPSLGDHEHIDISSSDTTLPLDGT